MERMYRLALALFSAAAFAHAERVVFTMLTAPTCPVLASSPEGSKDFGFQTVLFRNDAEKSLQSVYLTVTFYTAKTKDREEVVDSGHVYLNLEPGEIKRIDVFLGRIEALKQKAKSLGDEVAWAKLFVSGAEFTDGSRWEMDKPLEGVPVQEISPK